MCSVYSVVLKKSDSDGHGLVHVPESPGTTEQPEYTEIRHNRARIPFRVFCVFRGLKKVRLRRPRIGSYPRKPGNHGTTRIHGNKAHGARIPFRVFCVFRGLKKVRLWRLSHRAA